MDTESHRNNFGNQQGSAVGDSGEILPLAQRARHRSLWFEDGNIVLATPTVLFRVYRGILSHNSPVFRDLFSLAQADAGETMDGIPVVHIYDDHEELAHLLSTLHFNLYYCPKERTEFSVVAAVLRLSNKYQIENLREHAIRQLTTAYPDNHQDYGWFTMSLVDHTNHIDMIHIAREVDALQLLPAALYFTAIYLLTVKELEGPVSPMTLQSFLDHHSLSGEDVTRLLLGKENHRRTLRTDFGKFLYAPSPAGCIQSEVCRQHKALSLLTDTWIGWDTVPNVFSYTLAQTFQSSLTGLCLYCRGALQLSMEEARRNVWTNLPSCFGLQDWATLKATTVRPTRLAGTP